MHTTLTLPVVRKLARHAVEKLSGNPSRTAQLTRCKQILAFTDGMTNTAKFVVTLEDYNALTILPD